MSEKNHKKGFSGIKRLTASLLSVLMLLSVVPFSFADETTTGESTTYLAESTYENDETVPENYSVTTKPITEINEDYTPSGDTKGWEYKSTDLDKKFILVVSTGICNGNAIQYFSIRYKDAAGNERSQLVFPHMDSLYNGYAMAKNASSLGASRLVERVNTVARNTIYTTSYGCGKADGKTVRSGLTAYSTDMYLFDLHFGFTELIDIDIFMLCKEKSTTASTGTSINDKNQWTCRDIRLYSVDKLNGMNMLGYYSDDFYIDFDGKLVAQFEKKQSGGGDFATGMVDKVFRLRRDNSKYGLKTNIEKNAASYSTSSGLTELLFRIDFADKYECGIESLCNYYDSEKSKAQTKLKSMDLIEPLYIDFEYEDIYGIKRNVKLPVITSCVAWAVEQDSTLANASFIGIAQQGETLMFAGYFPDFVKMTGYKLYYGDDVASKIGLSVSGSTSSTSTFGKRKSSLQNDTFALTGLSIFDVSKIKSVTVKKDGASLLCSVSGNPLYYYTVSDSYGLSVKCGSISNMFGMFNTIPEGTENEFTYLVQNTDLYYIFEISTDTVELAGTTGDIELILTYVDSVGEEKETSVINVRKALGDFYGYWPGDGGDLSYYAGVASGGKVVFGINLNNVSYFKNIEMTLKDSDDEWQMSGLNIYRAVSLSHRVTAAIDKVKTFNGKSTWWDITRDYPVSDQMANYEKKILLSSTKHTVNISFDAGGTGGDVNETQTDWESLSKAMTFNEAQQNLGFCKALYTYDIDVKVASNENINGEDDSGSDNEFYFQIVFQNGTSAYVLANQQILADGFRAGQTESFSISVNRNYGDVKAIKIIPDDTQENANIYDKLNVDAIVVTQRSSIGVSNSWKIESIGWIAISYRDSGVKSTIEGEKLRSESEMAHNERITSKGYSMDFMVAVTTGIPVENNNLPQFRGAVVAEFTYINSKGEQDSRSIDMVDAISQYAERQLGSMEKIKANSGDSTKTLYVSNTDFMFRPNTTDRFCIALPDVRKIVGITIQAAGMVSTVWHITGIDIYTIESDGPAVINSKNEFQHTGEVKLLTSSLSTDGYEVPSQYDGTKSTFEECPITVGNNDISFDGDSWETVIEREPTTNDDELNYYVYFSDATDSSKLKNLTLRACVRYLHREDGAAHQSAGRTLTVVPEKNMAYIIGVGARGMRSLENITLESNRSVKVHHVIVQHVRSGVVINTYYVPFLDTDIHIVEGTSVTAIPEAREDALGEQQTISFQFAQNTSTVDLIASQTNIAVSFTYTTVNDVSEYEYESPTVYLTDQDIKQIKAGMVVDLKFNQQYVKEITKVSFAAIGTVSSTISSALALEYITDNTNTTKCTGHYNFDAVMPITRSKYSISATSKPVSALALSIKLGETGKFDTSGNTKIKAVIGIKRVGAAVITKLEYNDIFAYCATGKIEPNGVINWNTLISGAAEIAYIALYPVSTGTSLSAEIPVNDISLKTLQDGSAQTLVETADTTVVEGKGLVINILGLNMNVVTAVKNSDGTKGGVRLDTNWSKSPVDITMDADQYLQILPQIQNAVDEDSCEVTAERISGGNDNFTFNIFENDNNLTEYDFVPQPHYVGDATYRITVTSKEDRTKSLVVNLTVKAIDVPETTLPEETSENTESGENETETGESTTAEEAGTVNESTTAEPVSEENTTLPETTTAPVSTTVQSETTSAQN